MDIHNMHIIIGLSYRCHNYLCFYVGLNSIQCICYTHVAHTYVNTLFTIDSDAMDVITMLCKR
jgi:hypothetical protein